MQTLVSRLQFVSKCGLKASQDFNVLFPNCYEDAEGSS